MKILNVITKSWMQQQIAAMEKCKYETEGPARTAGSYMLTCTKSMLKLSDQDEAVFSEYAKYSVAPVVVAVAGTLTISWAGRKAYGKLKEYCENRKAIKEENKEKEND